MTWRDAVAYHLSLSLVSAAYAVAVHGAIRSQSALYSTPLDRALGTGLRRGENGTGQEDGQNLY